MDHLIRSTMTREKEEGQWVTVWQVVKNNDNPDRHEPYRVVVVQCDLPDVGHNKKVDNAMTILGVTRNVGYNTEAM